MGYSVSSMERKSFCLIIHWVILKSVYINPFIQIPKFIMEKVKKS